MKPSWMIQTNMYDVDTKPMIAEVKKQGMETIEVEHYFSGKMNFEEYDTDDCIICYGDIDFVRHVINRAPFIPGAFCNFNNMKCSTYYSYFGDYLLNKDYLMMPVGDLLRRWDDLTVMFGKTASIIRRSLFIRPDSGAKPFTGYLVAPGDKHRILPLIQAVGPETLVVVAPERRIPREWRFVICDRQVVAGCQYLPDEQQSYPSTSFRLAKEIANHEWQPDICYTADIAEHDGRVYLLEINSFSAAGLYDCDMESIVRCASLAAEKEWQEYQ